MASFLLWSPQPTLQRHPQKDAHVPLGETRAFHRTRGARRAPVGEGDLHTCVMFKRGELVVAGGPEELAELCT